MYDTYNVRRRMMYDYITKNFQLIEFVKSNKAIEKGIDNTPEDRHIECIKRLANVLQIIRDVYGKPITITSGYRCPKLNKLVGGESNSQHLEGSAVDIICEDNQALFNLILSLVDEGVIEFRQIIDEYNYSWIHLSINDSNHSYKKNEVLHIN